MTVPATMAAHPGADGRFVHTGPNTNAGVIATLDAAEAAGKGTVAYFPAARYDLGTGLALSGYSCQIQGAGAAGTTGAPSGTIFWASAQTGPVLDFTGWISPQSFQGKVRHGGFHVLGSAVADATKARSGIRLASISSTTFADIAIRDTGGPCLEGVSSPGDAVYLCDFERIVLCTPVSAKANDVPYLVLNEPNGNAFRSLGFRSVLPAADVGASGALVITNNASFAGYGNTFQGWFEYLHVPNGGTLINARVNTSTFEFEFHDPSKESGASGTSFARFAPPTVTNYGGNTWRGTVPGCGGAPSDIDCGIDMQQSRNRVDGVKGYKGKNVLLASGVTGTHVSFGGSVSGATDPGVIDNSGNNTNIVIDPLAGRLPYEHKVSLNPYAYGVMADGVTDDTTAMRALITAAQGASVTSGVPGAHLVFPSGEVVLSDTITFSRMSGIFEGQGQEQSPQYSAQPGHATVFRWNGPSDRPMFKVQDSRSLIFKNFRMEGKDSSQPTYAIEFNNAGGSSGTNEFISVKDVRIGRHAWSTQGENVGRVQSGIGFTGINANNDQFHIEDVVLSYCSGAGIDLPNSQSIWGEIRNTFFDTCGVGLRASATTIAFNVSFNACTKDIECASSAAPQVYGWFSENSAQIFDLTQDSGIRVHGGKWTISAPMQGAPYFARAAALTNSVILDGVEVAYQITPKPPLSLVGTYSTHPYTIAIRACLGLDLATMSGIQGYGAPGYTYLDICTGGFIYRGSITAVPLRAHIQTKTSGYSLTQADRVIIANGSSLSMNLPDPTLTPTDREYVIKNIAATAVTVASLGASKTIDGAATKTLAQWAVGRYVTDGTQWLSV